MYTNMTVEREAPSKFHDIRYEIRGPLQQRAEEMERQGEKILHLNIGDPAPFGFRAPARLLRAYTEQLTGAEGYSASKGLLRARRAIDAYCRKKGMVPYSMDTIYTGNGVSELILMSMQALLENGDEMLVPAPDYPLWTGAVRLAGGRAVHYICDEWADWCPDLADMEKKITPRTRGIVLIHPNNPTGALYPPAVLDQVGALARRHGLILFADEIYDRLVLDGGVHTAVAAAVPDVPVACYNGLSKSHLIPGFRCGWLCLCGDWSRQQAFLQGMDLLSSMRLCANVPAQTVIPQALAAEEEMQALLAPGGRIHAQREAICDALSKIPGIQFFRPRAGFYVFPRVDLRRYPAFDDRQFAARLLQRERILLTPGTGFNWNRPDHFRIVFLPRSNQLRYGAERIGAVLETFA